MSAAKKIANFFLSLSLLIATTGFTFNAHYCLGQIKSVSINENIKYCNGEEKPMPCCKDISQELKVEEITQAGFDFDSAPDLYEVAIITWFVSTHTNLQALERTYPPLYSPPPLHTDFQSSYQVFLI